MVCVYVFSQKQLRKSKFNLYLLVLAIFELIICLIIFFEYLCRLTHPYKLFLHELNQLFNIIVNFSFHTAESYLILLTLLLSIDRLYAFKHPIDIKCFITHLHAKRLIAITLIITILLQIASAVVRNQVEVLNFCVILVSAIIFNIIPTLIILVLNSLLIREIIAYYKRKMISTVCCDKFCCLEKSNSYQTVLFLNSCRSTIKPINCIQKSHYLVIILLALWLVLTTVPYCVSNSLVYFFHRISFSNNYQVKINDAVLQRVTFIQAICSILFNSNHYFKFFVYINFHALFRNFMWKRFKMIFCIKNKSG